MLYNFLWNLEQIFWSHLWPPTYQRLAHRVRVWRVDFTLQLILIQKQSCRNDFSEVYSLFVRLIFVVTISLTCIVKGFIWADLMTRNKVDNTEWFIFCWWYFYYYLLKLSRQTLRSLCLHLVTFPIFCHLSIWLWTW